MSSPAPRRLLLINPNTSDGVTTHLRQLALASLPAGVEVSAVTARFGAPYIADEAGYAVAAHAVLDAWAQASRRARFDAVLIGCFGDPGLFALRDLAPCPVTGLAEAAVGEAASLGGFVIVTGGEDWRPMLLRLCPQLLGGDRLLGIETVTLTGAQLREAPQLAMQLLQRACQQALGQTGAEAIVLGGAGLGGLAAHLQGELGVPIVDSVLAGLHRVWQAPAGRALGAPPWLAAGLD